MKIPMYLSCPSSEYRRARMWAAKLESTGVIAFTDRWFDTAHEWTGNEGKMDRVELAKIALRELEAVRAAAIVWVMWPSRPTNSGALVELGAALLARLPDRHSPWVIVTGYKSHENLFTALADYRDTVDALGFHSAVRVANDFIRKGKVRT